MPLYSSTQLLLYGRGNNFDRKYLYNCWKFDVSTFPVYVILEKNPPAPFIRVSPLIWASPFIQFWKKFHPPHLIGPPRLFNFEKKSTLPVYYGLPGY